MLGQLLTYEQEKCRLGQQHIATHNIALNILVFRKFDYSGCVAERKGIPKKAQQEAEAKLYDVLTRFTGKGIAKRTG